MWERGHCNKHLCPCRLVCHLYYTSQVVFTLVVPVSGALSDRGLPRVTTNIVIACISGALYVPSFLAFQTRSILACWLLQGLHLALAAWAMGVLPAIVSRIYPAGVRISGFNLGHNFGELSGRLHVTADMDCFCQSTQWQVPGYPAEWQRRPQLKRHLVLYQLH